jgi:hypothetical protein
MIFNLRCLLKVIFIKTSLKMHGEAKKNVTRGMGNIYDQVQWQYAIEHNLGSCLCFLGSFQRKNIRKGMIESGTFEASYQLLPCLAQLIRVLVVELIYLNLNFISDINTIFTTNYFFSGR